MKKITNVLFESKKELTDAMKERGARQLLRLGFITDVLFALMIFQLFMFLPRPEVDNFDATNLVTADPGILLFEKNQGQIFKRINL